MQEVKKNNVWKWKQAIENTMRDLQCQDHRAYDQKYYYDRV